MEKSNNILGNENIGKLLLRMSAPAVIGMLVNSLYNVVDTIFIAKGVGTDAVGGLALAFPIQMLIMAIGTMFGTGAASLISRYLGAGKNRSACLTAGNVLLFSLVTGILLTVPLLLSIESILKMIGATNDLLPYAYEYSSIILIGAPIMIFAMSANNIARAEGNAKVAMISMLVGTGANILLDPIFIFVFNMGIKGAAIATVISQTISFIFMLLYFIKGTSRLQLTVDMFKIKLNTITDIFILGLPSFIRQAGTSIIAIVINVLLAFYGGDLAISTFGVINRLLMFGLMPIFGIAQGFQPIAGFNYGALKLNRVKSVLKQSIVVSTIFCLSYSMLMFIFPEFMLSIFSKDQELIQFGTKIIKIIVVMMPFVGIQIIGAAYFLSIGKSFPSMVLGLSRQIIILLPLMLIMPKYLGLRGIWLAFPIADLAALLITVIWLLIEVKKLTMISTDESKKIKRIS